MIYPENTYFKYIVTNVWKDGSDDSTSAFDERFDERRKVENRKLQAVENEDDGTNVALVGVSVVIRDAKLE